MGVGSSYAKVEGSSTRLQVRVTEGAGGRRKEEAEELGTVYLGLLWGW